MLLSRILTSYVFRYTFWYATGLSIAVFALLGIIYAAYSYNVYNAIDKSLRLELQRFESEVMEGGVEQARSNLQDRVSKEVSNPYFYLLVDQNYRKIAGNLQAWPEHRAYDTGWLTFEIASLQGGPQSDLRFGARAMDLENGHRLLVAKDTSVEDDKIEFLISILLRGMLATIVLGAIGGAIISSFLLRRVELFNSSIRKIMTGNLSERLPVRGYSGDFRELEINLNHMLDRIQSLMVGVRRVSDNIAHDLRTPLTRIRGQLTVLQQNAPQHNQETIKLLIDEADELLATFNAALKIAQIETGNRRTEFYDFDLQLIVTDVVELYEPLASEKNIEISVNTPYSVNLFGDRDLLFQAVANLIDNAIKYTPEGGRVEIELSRKGNNCQLLVQDNGIGIPAADRHRVFERFFRVEESRGQYPGNGLGLSLVAAVIKFHSGTIDLVNNDPGLGVAIELPLREAA